MRPFRKKVGNCIAAAGVTAMICTGCSGNESDRNQSDSPPPSKASTQVIQRSGPDSEGFYDPNEALLRTAECLQQDGWDVTIDDRIGLVSYESNTTVDQESAFSSAETACREKFPYREITPADWSDQDWRDVYDSDLTTADCLRREGHSVPDAPSFDTYREQYDDPDGWSPYKEITVGQSEWERLNMACPQG